MRQFAVVAAILAVWNLSACTHRPPEVDLPAEAQTIQEMTADWFAAEVRRDIEASLSYLAPDAIIQTPGAPAIAGTAAIRAAYEAFFEIPFTDLVMEPRTVVVATSGDMAYDIGPWKMVVEGRTGRVEVPLKSINIWRKLNGEWKCVAASMNPDAEQHAPLSEEEEAAIAKTVEQTVLRYIEAIRKLDLERMLEFYADSDAFVYAGDGTLTAGYDAWAAQLRETVGPLAAVHAIETTNPHTYVLGRDAAAYTMQFEWSMGTTAGDTVKSRGSWTYVFKRLDGHWKVVHSTGTHVPIPD